MQLILRENKVIAYNDTIAKKEAQKCLSSDVVWIDDLCIEPPMHTANQYVNMYLNEDNTIRYEIVDITPELSPAEQAQLDNDELLLDMYLLQLDTQLSLQTGGDII